METLLEQAYKYEKFADIPHELVQQLNRKGYFYIITYAHIDGEVREAFNFVKRNSRWKRRKES